MKTTHDYLRDRLLTQANIPLRDDFGKAPPLEVLFHTEISLEFFSEMRSGIEEYLTLMRNRMIAGYFRYGPKYENPKRIDNIPAMRRLIREYEKKRNKEYLVDLSNYSMLEFKYGNHPDSYFKSLDDSLHFG